MFQFLFGKILKDYSTAVSSDSGGLSSPVHMLSALAIARLQAAQLPVLEGSWLPQIELGRSIGAWDGVWDGVWPGDCFSKTHTVYIVAYTQLDQVLSIHLEPYPQILSIHLEPP